MPAEIDAVRHRLLGIRRPVNTSRGVGGRPIVAVVMASGLVPGHQDPATISPLHDTCFAQREDHALGEIRRVGITDIVQFHREPGDITLAPHLQAGDRNVQFDDGIEFAAHVAGEVRPSYVFSSVECVPDGIGVMGHVV